MFQEEWDIFRDRMNGLLMNRWMDYGLLDDGVKRIC